MPATSLNVWLDRIVAASPVDRPAVLDVGTGTGVFAIGFATRYAPALVVGIDPSRAMLREAVRHRGDATVQFALGDATNLPLADTRFDLALLSRVIHHVSDRRRCATELRRVLRPHGVVVVRTTLQEHLDALVYDYWPQLRDSDKHRFPALRDVIADFAAAGFAVREVDSVSTPVYADLAAFYRAMQLRPQSKFANLPDEEFRSGLSRVRRDSRTQPAEPINERYDFLVFGPGRPTATT